MSLPSIALISVAGDRSHDSHMAVTWLTMHVLGHCVQLLHLGHPTLASNQPGFLGLFFQEVRYGYHILILKKGGGGGGGGEEDRSWGMRSGEEGVSKGVREGCGKDKVFST